MLGGSDAARVSRKPEIIADSAYAIFCRDSKTFTGNFTIDDEILKEEGITDLDQYAVDPCK
jgi:citronellol/citronellal dehydrogenase